MRRRPLITANDARVDLKVPKRVKRAYQSAASRAGLTLSEWLRRIADAALTTPPA